MPTKVPYNWQSPRPNGGGNKNSKKYKQVPRKK
jgi:hypothetical protein